MNCINSPISVTMNDLFIFDLMLLNPVAELLVMRKSSMNKSFSMTNLGLLRQFIGLEVSQNTLGIVISQSRYSLDMLRIFHMEDCKQALFPFLSGIILEEGGSTPLVDNTLFRQLIGSLLYLTHSRPYISYIVSVVSRYMHEPHEVH